MALSPSDFVWSFNFRHFDYRHGSRNVACEAINLDVLGSERAKKGVGAHPEPSE
jgi:hypothetical protein